MIGLQEWPQVVKASVQTQSEKYKASADQLKGSVTEWAEVMRQNAPSTDLAAGTCSVSICSGTHMQSC